MATVTVNRPEPVEVPPTTYTLEMTEHEAIYVTAMLGFGTQASALGGYATPVFYVLADALEGEGISWEETRIAREVERTKGRP